MQLWISLCTTRYGPSAPFAGRAEQKRAPATEIAGAPMLLIRDPHHRQGRSAGSSPGFRPGDAYQRFRSTGMRTVWLLGGSTGHGEKAATEDRELQHQRDQ